MRVIGRALVGSAGLCVGLCLVLIVLFVRFALQAVAPNLISGWFCVAVAAFVLGATWIVGVDIVLVLGDTALERVHGVAAQDLQREQKERERALLYEEGWSFGVGAAVALICGGLLWLLPAREAWNVAYAGAVVWCAVLFPGSYAIAEAYHLEPRS